MYNLLLPAGVRTVIDRLPFADGEGVLTAVAALADDPRPPGSVRVMGLDYWRIVVQVYRVVYAIDDGARVVTIVAVAHRQDMYR